MWRPLSLDPDRLISQALRKSGHDDFGDPPIEEPLRRLVESLDTEAHLTTIGRLSVRQYLLEMLTTRLQLANAWARTPEIQAQPMRGPLVITGMARSGTTFLHSLLAQDPANRVPSIWEVMFPHPPPRREGFAADPRIRKTERRLRAFRWLAPRVQEIHPLSATLAQECIAILSYAFYSDEFVALFRVPGYERWLRQQHLLGAYRFHQRFLKHLQWHYRSERWVLKAPDHGWGLEALFQTYPDAGVVRLLRDPLKVLASTTSLTAILQGAFSRHPDVDEIGAHEVCAQENLLQQWTQFQARHAELTPQILEVHYLDLIREPLATARRVFFADSMFAGKKARAMALMEALIPLNIRWSTLWTTYLCLDDEYMDLAKRSGLLHVNMGMESVSPDTLVHMNKRFNKVPQYAAIAEALRRRGISYSLNFVFGYDGEPPEVYEVTLQFLQRYKVPVAYFYILDPHKGTPLYERLKADDRLLNEAEMRQRWGNVCKIKPTSCTPQELEARVMRMYERFYSLPSMLRRLPLSPSLASLASWALNLSQRKMTNRESLVENFDWA